MELEKEVIELLGYMNRKYGESFRFMEKYAGQIGRPYMEILVKSKQNPERIALVRRREQEGQVYFEDNYLAFLLKEELQKAEQELVNQSIGVSRVNYKIPAMVFPYTFRKDMSAEEFLKKAYGIPEFLIVPKGKRMDYLDEEKKVKTFCHLNRQRGYQVKGSVQYGKEELMFSMKEKEGFHYFRWARR